MYIEAGMHIYSLIIFLVSEAGIMLSIWIICCRYFCYLGDTWSRY